MELNIIVQDKDELDVRKVLEFIEKQDNRKFVLIYSALKDEMTRLNFFTSLLKKNDYDFLACNFSGFITNSGYYNDAIAVCVFSGDFQAEIHHIPIEYKNIEETEKRINQKIRGDELCITYTANLFQENYKIDKILRGMQEKNPMMQIFGASCSCSPPPMIATRDGIFSDVFGLVLIKKIDTVFEIDTGFDLDMTSSHEFKITKCDEDVITQIDGKNAAQEFQRIQHVRDYLFNRVMEMVSKQDVMDLPKYFKGANEIILDVVNQGYKNLLANKSEHGFINLFVTIQIEENRIRLTNYRPEGTTLKKTKTNPEKQLATYDRLYEKYPNAKAIILSDCAMRPYYYEYNIKEATKRLQKFKQPFISPLVWGEFGTYLPYENPEENILHNATIKALMFE